MSEYKFLLIPLIALITAQIIKFIIESFKCKRLIWGRLFNGCGGMPSSHTTFCFAITTCLLIEYGLTNPVTALSLVFSLIVSYDAMGLRMESGKQAEAINQIMDELFKKDKKSFKRLKEKLGHNPLEVLGGIVYGSVISYILMVIWK